MKHFEEAITIVQGEGGQKIDWIQIMKDTKPVATPLFDFTKKEEDS